MPLKHSSQHYNKAPIVEALIDIRVDLPEKIDLKSIIKIMKTEYPSQEEISYETNKIELSNKEAAKISTIRKNIGYKLISDNKKYVVQIRENGFTFSSLGNYENWDIFCEKAKQAWELYKKLAPSKITRVAVRYINRIDIPELKFRLGDYFYTFPHVFKNDAGDLSAFYMQLQLPQKEGGMAILNQSLTIPISPGYTSVLLDIDVFDLKNLAPHGNELWDRINLLRDQKNDIFEQSITDKTRNLIS